MLTEWIPTDAVTPITKRSYNESPSFSTTYKPQKRKSMSQREARLLELGYEIEKTTPEGSLVDAVSMVGNLIYASGQVPFDGDQLKYVGKVPSQISMEDATQAAALCTANVLRAVRKAVGSLESIDRIVRITGYVNCEADFTQQHLVINGASQLVRDVFGEAGRHARTAVGMQQLPLGVSVEVEMILLQKE